MRVLLPVEILEGGSVSPGLFELLEPAEVVLLGYHELPDQTPPDQARFQYEERAMAALEDIADTFDGDVEVRLVFTHERGKTIQRMAEETGANAYVIGGPAGSIDRLLVALTGDIDADRVVEFVTALVDGRSVAVTLFSGDPDETAAGDRLQSSTQRLEAAGIDTTSVTAQGPGAFQALINAVPGHDAVVLGERAPSLASFLFGDEAERVAAESVGPVLVVRRPDPDTGA